VDALLRMRGRCGALVSVDPASMPCCTRSVGCLPADPDIGSKKIGCAMKTFSAKGHEVHRDWFVVDANEKILGRLAAEIALRLRGKHKPEYTPHVDTGDFIVVVNAGKMRVTGNKSEGKIYYRHSTYPGGVYETSFGKMQQRFPGRALQLAVKGMLPKGPLGYAMIKKLKVYAEADHPHTAQQPKPLNIGARATS